MLLPTAYNIEAWSLVGLAGAQMGSASRTCCLANPGLWLACMYFVQALITCKHRLPSASWPNSRAQLTLATIAPTSAAPSNAVLCC